MVSLVEGAEINDSTKTANFLNQRKLYVQLKRQKCNSLFRRRDTAGLLVFHAELRKKDGKMVYSSKCFELIVKQFFD